MPGTTPNRSYPYPVGGDTINPPRDIKALADAVDADFASFVTSAQLATGLATKLNLSGGTLTGQVNGIAPTAAANLTRKDYVDALVAGKLNLAGGTLTGQVNGITPTAAANLTRKDYVDTQDGLRVAVAGDAMTGLLTITPGATGSLALRLRSGSNNPYVDFTNAAGTVQYGYLQGAAGMMTLQSNGDARILATGQIHFYSSATFQGFISGSNFVWGKAASDLNNAGIEMFGAGSGVEGSIRTTTQASAIQNLYCRHVGAANAVGNYFAQFAALSVSVGTISQTAGGVAYNTTSDYRLKNDMGPVPDALERLLALNPRHMMWKATPVYFDGFFAHEVAEVVPEAVTGEKDAVYPVSDDDTMPAAGTIMPQQLDYSKLVPLLVAAVQELAAQVEALS